MSYLQSQHHMGSAHETGRSLTVTWIHSELINFLNKMVAYEYVTK